VEMGGLGVLGRGSLADELIVAPFVIDYVKRLV
jgi:hypothetical protein